MKYYQNEYFGRIYGAMFYRSLEESDNEHAWLTVKAVYAYQRPAIGSAKLIKIADEKHIDLISYRMAIDIVRSYFKHYKYQPKDKLIGEEVKVVNVCNLLVWEEKSYRDGIPAIVVDVERNKEGEKRYLCEFENRERKWIAEDRIRKVYEDA